MLLWPYPPSAYGWLGTALLASGVGLLLDAESGRVRSAAAHLLQGLGRERASRPAAREPAADDEVAHALGVPCRIGDGERGALRLTAEGFNITNRTNFARVNNIVGAAFGPPFNAHGTASLSPSQPLGFTGALPKREIQLSIRFDF